jgi:hypothetical protein
MAGTPSSGSGEVGKSIQWQGTVGRLGAGAYTLSAPVKIPSGGKLDFGNAQIARSADVPMFVIDAGSSGVGLSGTVAADGGAFQRPFLLAMNATGVNIELDLQASKFRPSAIFTRGCSNVKLAGAFRSPDSPIIRAVDTSGLDVSGVRCTYQSDPGDSAVRVVSSGKSGPTANIYVHDCFVDGGGVFNTRGALINIGAEAGDPINSVRLENIELRRTVRPRDGIDIGQCRQVTIRNVFGRDVNTLVSALGGQMEISDVLAVECDAQSVALGDPQYQTTNVDHCAVRRAWAVNCGRGYKNAASSGHGVQTTAPFLVSDVVFEDCGSVSLGAAYPLYGFAAFAGARTVELSRCRFAGSKAPILDLSPPGSIQASSAGGGPLGAASLVGMSSNPWTYAKKDPGAESLWLLSDLAPTFKVSHQRVGSEVAPSVYGHRYDLQAGDTLTVTFQGTAPRFLRVPA